MRNMTDGMNHLERIAALRFDFGVRVGDFGAEPWCITEAEAEKLLADWSVNVLLPAFTKVGAEVKKLRDRELLYLDEEEVLQLLAKYIVVVKQSQETDKGKSRQRRSNMAVAV